MLNNSFNSNKIKRFLLKNSFIHATKHKINGDMETGGIFLSLATVCNITFFDIDFFIYGRLEKQTTVKIYHVCQNECNLKLYHALRKLKVTYSPFQLECSCVNFIIPMCAKKICKHQLFLCKYVQYFNTT